MASREQTPVDPGFLGQAKELLSSQLTEDQFATHITDERLEEVARWIEKGWNVEVTFRPSGWRDVEGDWRFCEEGVLLRPVTLEEAREREESLSDEETNWEQWMRGDKPWTQYNLGKK